tara:strand:+ start:476 stop:14077 length:13602 start_codon:yes stop_codon:yes gene_type:complete
MITTNTRFEPRVQIQDLVNDHVPQYILEENPKFVDFLRQYYISQEYQGGSADLISNLDQYLKLDNLRPEVIGGTTKTVGITTSGDTTIDIDSIQGFPDKYGLIKIFGKIDGSNETINEIITYKDKEENRISGICTISEGQTIAYVSGIDESLYLGRPVKFKTLKNSPTIIEITPTYVVLSESPVPNYNTPGYTATNTYEFSLTRPKLLNCIRRYSGISAYHQITNPEELVFESTKNIEQKSYIEGSSVENLSVLFLKEFYQKTKKTFAYGFEGRELAKELNVGNFLKEIKSFYESKGTDASIEILLKVLFNEKGSSINLEDRLLKPSDAEFIRREVVVAEVISGDVNNLRGQTIYKNTDIQTRAVISEVEIFTRRNNEYYKLNLYVGYDDKSSIEGTFEITPSTKCLELLSPGSTVMTVDSTAGFPNENGKLFSGNNEITYLEKNNNQFLGLSGVSYTINPMDNVRSDKIYYGYENGDSNKKCTFRITGVISDLLHGSSNDFVVSEGQEVSVSNLGDVIRNPQTKTYKEIFANSWIYNTSSTVDIEDIEQDALILKTEIDKSQFKIGDRIEIVDRYTSEVIYPTELTDKPFITNIAQDDSGLSKILYLDAFTFEKTSGTLYSVRRSVNKAHSKNVPIEYGNDQITSDIQNLYTEKTEDGEYAYVATNSLPSSTLQSQSSYTNSEFVLDITKTKYSYEISPLINTPLLDVDEETLSSSGRKEYTTIKFPSRVDFLTGDRVYYEYSGFPLVGLSTGSYFVKVLSDPDPEIDKTKIKLYSSKSHILTGSDGLKFYDQSLPGIGNVSGTHKFSLYSHRESTISPKKILKKFKLESDLKSGMGELTKPGSIGILKNGVEIENYKTEEKIYYGPLQNLRILNSGSGYDVVNAPKIVVESENSTVEALIQPVISGDIVDFVVEDNEINIGEITSINVTGGNGNGGEFEPILTTKRIELLFDSRTTTNGGGINTDTSSPQITFIEPHNLVNGQVITYLNLSDTSNVSINVIDPSTGNLLLDSGYLTDNADYYVSVDNNKTIKLYESFQDYSARLNPVSFGSTGTGGIQRFVVGEPRKVLSEIKIIQPGSFTNRKLIVNPVGINTVNNTINFKNHNFEDGDIIEYNYEDSSIQIDNNGSELSTLKSFYVLKTTNDSFRLCDAGIGATIRSNYENKNYVRFTSKGEGYQYFKYPDIIAEVNYTSIGSTQTNTFNLTPIIKGKIIDAYLYEPGSGYGSDIIDFEKLPKISVLEGKRGQVQPVISSGVIVDTNVQFSGYDYFSTPDLVIVDPTGSGSGGKVRAIINNGSITGAEVVNSGRGYSDQTRIDVVNSGNGALFEANIRSLDINNVNKTSSKNYQVLKTVNNALNYSIAAYYNDLQVSFNDIGNRHSDIIGWSYDGIPIYGPYGFSDPTSINSTVRRMKSGYKLDIDNITDRPQNFPLGFFVDDYIFDNSGDLDKSNGRFAKTKDFPNGIYAYYATLGSQSELSSGTGEPEFPYFIGKTYRSNTLSENVNLNQKSFDLNSSNLLRNTFPYKISELYANNDFIVETNEITRQKSVVEDVQSGSIDSVEIVSSGDQYKVNDTLVFDHNGTGGGGASGKVFSVKGKNIESITTEINKFNNSTFVWKSPSEVRVYTGIPTSSTDLIESTQNGQTTFSSDIYRFNTDEYISITGLSSTPNSQILSFENDFERIIVDNTSSMTLSQDIGSLDNSNTTSETTSEYIDIYVSNLPDSVGADSWLIINEGQSNDTAVKVDETTSVEVAGGQELVKVIEVFPNINALRIRRVDSTPNKYHLQGSSIKVLDYSFSINKNVDYFNSSINKNIYFNPSRSLGIGVDGDPLEVTFNFGGTNLQYSTPISRSILNKRIYLENHNLKTGDKLTLRTPGGSGSIEISTDGVTTSQLTDGGDVYVINKSPNTIALTQSLGGDELYFHSFTDPGDETINEYHFSTNYYQENAIINLIKSTVSLGSSSELTTGDMVSLVVKPNLSVGIGSSTIVKLVQNSNNIIGLNTAYIANVGGFPIDQFRIQGDLDHGFKTGDRVLYNSIGSEEGYTLSNGETLNNRSLFVVKVTDKIFSLSDSLSNALSLPPVVVSAVSEASGTTNHKISLLNPKIEVIKGNDLVFDTSDSTLSGKTLKIYYDNEFNNEFISSGSISEFNVSRVGVAGTDSSKLTINYSDDIPEKLYYAFESNSGLGIIDADKEVLDFSEIEYVDSEYTDDFKTYITSGITTQFKIFLKKNPEKISYAKTECSKIEYTTTSLSASGSVNEIELTSFGVNYKSLPVITDIKSKNGKGFSGIAKSKDIGNINKISILNEGFEYSSDKTLTPKVFVSPNIVLSNSNILTNITVNSGGKNYIFAPDLILIDSITRKRNSDGVLKPILSGESIIQVNVESPMKGLSKDNEIFAINNSNGISIRKVDSSNTGIFTCHIKTPQAITGQSGFRDPFTNVEIDAFAAGDRVFIEGVQKLGTDGTGFNSSDYGYKFFTVSGYDNTTLHHTVTIDATEYTSNTGSAKVEQDSSGTIVSKKNYPEFTAFTRESIFLDGEDLLVNDVSADLGVISQTNLLDLNVKGTYELRVGDKLTGKSSLNVAYIDKLSKLEAKYKVDYSISKNLGWESETGRLNEDYQSLADNDYYQTLSYSIKSPLTWDQIKSPVNNLIHVSGMKNFADSEFISKDDERSGIVTATSDVDVFLDVISDLRVDTIYNFDQTRDYTAISSVSKFLEFQSSIFIPYVETRSNVVLKVDDLSSEYSNFESDPKHYVDILQVKNNNSYNNYTFMLTDVDNTEIQLTTVKVIADQSSNSYILEKETISNKNTEYSSVEGGHYGDFSLETNEFDETFLRFTPHDPYNTDYDIKILDKSFTNNISSGQISVGFVDVIGIVTGIGTNLGFTTIFSYDKSDYNAFLVDSYARTVTGNESSYSQIYISHDNQDLVFSEYQFNDAESDKSPLDVVGIFTAGLTDSNKIELLFNNTRENDGVIVSFRIVGFGNVSDGIGTYRFSTDTQPPGAERTAIYQSGISTTLPVPIYDTETTYWIDDGTSSTIQVDPSPATILTLDKNIFSAATSIVRVSYGSTFALHQVSLVQDGTEIHVHSLPFLTTDGNPDMEFEDGTSIGIFGGSIVGNDFNLLFWPTDIIPFPENDSNSVHYISNSDNYNYVRDNQHIYDIDGDGVISSTDWRLLNRWLTANFDEEVFINNYWPNINTTASRTGKQVYEHLLKYHNEGLLQVPTDVQSGDPLLYADTAATMYKIFALSASRAIIDNQNIELESLSECFYTTVDFLNIPEELQFGSSVERMDAKQFLAIFGERINKKNFTPRSNGTPIFAKTFNPNSILDLDRTTGLFTIKDHFFSHGEELEYIPISTFVGVGQTPMTYIDPTDNTTERVLPSTVYACVNTYNDYDSFGISTVSGSSYNNRIQSFPSPGEGNAHKLSMKKSLSKSLFTVDGIVQSPISFTNLSYSITNNITENDNIISLSGIQTVNVSNILKIDDEYVSVTSVGIGTSTAGPISGIGTYNLVSVERGILGTVAGIHTTVDVGLYKGTYNIVKDEIFFIEAPKGNSSITRTANNLQYQTSTFSGRAFLRQDYDTNRVYDDFSPQFNGITSSFLLTENGISEAGTNGIGTVGGNGIVLINGIFQTPSANNNPNNNFEIIEGTNNDSTLKFTGYKTSDGFYGGISETDVNANQLPRGGMIVSFGSTGGLGYAPLVGARIDLILDSDLAEGQTTGQGFDSNHPGSGNETGEIVDIVGKKIEGSTVKTTALNIVSGSPSIDIPDLASVGITSGMIIKPIDNLIGHETEVLAVDAGNNTILVAPSPIGSLSSIELEFFNRDPIGGSGYSDVVGYGMTIKDLLHAGNDADIQIQITDGGVLSFNIIDGGSGYTNPEATVSEPTYSNLEVVGVDRVGFGTTTDTGLGLIVTAEVGSPSIVGVGTSLGQITGFKIARNGYAFREGDRFTPVGLVTAAGLSEPIDPFILTADEVYSDSFSAWQFGEMDFIDSIKSLQDGIRTRFPIKYNNELLSFQKANNVRMELSNALIVVVNGVIQDPGINYFFEGGSSFIFTEPPKEGDDIAIFFYRGTSGQDDFQVGNVVPTVEPGDIIKVDGKYSESIPEQQSGRVVFDYEESDILETTPYNGVGINEITYRPASWTKQKSDLILGGNYVFKTRRSLISQTYPTSKVIWSFDENDQTLYVENSELFTYDDTQNNFEQQFVIVANSDTFIPAELNANINVNDGTVTSINVTNPGFGYSSTSNGIIELEITPPTSQLPTNWPQRNTDGYTSVPDLEELTRYLSLPSTSPSKATAEVAINSNGELVGVVTITSPGSGYTTTPIVSAPISNRLVEVTNKCDGISGFSGIITHIQSGTDANGKYIEFMCSKYNEGTGIEDFDHTANPAQDLAVGDPIFVSNTSVGDGVISIATDYDDNNVVGVGTIFIDNIYQVASITPSSGSYQDKVVIIKSYIDSNTNISGISSSGTPTPTDEVLAVQRHTAVGTFSWGKITFPSFRSESAISIAVTGRTCDNDLSNFPTIQRRGYGLRDTGSLLDEL